MHTFVTVDTATKVGACLFQTKWSISFGMTTSILQGSQRGRPREFDQDVAIENAMNAFWTLGYHGASLPDLLEATNLSRGSLYAAFGDKHGLFLLALDRYIAQSLERLKAEMQSENPLAGVSACLSRYAERSMDGKRGCLIVAAAMELGGHDDQVAQRISYFFDRMEAWFSETLTRAKIAGDLANDVDPSIAARLMMCAIEGRCVVDKTNSDRGKSKKMFQALIHQISRR